MNLITGEENQMLPEQHAPKAAALSGCRPDSYSDVFLSMPTLYAHHRNAVAGCVVLLE
jgi:hypothetical protein